MTKLNNEQVSGLFMMMQSWGEVRFKDPLISQRALRLRRRLKDDAETMSETYQSMRKAFVEEHGVLRDGEEEKVLLAGSDAAKKWREEEKRFLAAGEVEVTEQFKYSELMVRDRNSETGKISEYLIDLSPNDIERLGDVLILDDKKPEV